MFQGGIHMLLHPSDGLTNILNLELYIWNSRNKTNPKERLLRRYLKKCHRFWSETSPSQKSNATNSSLPPSVFSALEMRFNLQHPGCNYTQVLFNQTGEATFEENTWCAKPTQLVWGKLWLGNMWTETRKATDSTSVDEKHVFFFKLFL